MAVDLAGSGPTLITLEAGSRSSSDVHIICKNAQSGASVIRECYTHVK